VFVPGVSYNSGRYWEEYDDGSERAGEAADVDVVVCVVGENSDAGRPGELGDLELSARQQNLVRRLARGEADSDGSE
jgi:beta-glucosidase